MHLTNKMKPNPNVARQLGAMEALMSAQYTCEFYVGCAVSCRYKIPKSTHDAFGLAGIYDIFERAVALTVLDHPLLQVALTDEDKKRPLWVMLDSINLKDQIQWQTVGDDENFEESLRQTLERQHATHFANAGTRPSWRLVVLNSPNPTFLEAFFIYNHSIGDGMSGKIFHQTLLANLEAQKSKEPTVNIKDHLLTVPQCSTFTRPINKLLKFPISPSYLATEAWKLLIPHPQVKSGPSAAWAPIQLTPNKTSIAVAQVNGERLKTILETCRQQKTTLTGLLHALILVSISTRLDASQARAFISGTPISMRRFVDPGLEPDKTIANIVTYWHYQFDKVRVAMLRQQVEQVKAGTAGATEALESTTWAAASDFRQALVKKLKTGTKNDSIGLMKLVSDWRAYVMTEAKKPRVVSWEVSNLGVVNGVADASNDATGHDEQRWEIERALFTQSAAITGPAICVNPVAVKGGDLTVTFCWQGDVVNNDLVRGLCLDLSKWLDAIGQDGYFQIGKSD